MAVEPCGACGVLLDPDGVCRNDQCVDDGDWYEEPPGDESDEEPLFIDVAAILAGGLPEPPKPVLLRREDGHRLFYAGKVNVLFGDPECGKTWIALAAVVEALNAGRRCAIVDLDHNGPAEIVGRLLALGARPDVLGDPNRFRLAEPDEGDTLILAVAALRRWRPAVAVVDSLGEVLPMLGLSSNSPDDYTSANRRVLTPLANAGAAVIGIDHMPKGEEARKHGQTGTNAKRRTVNGVTLLVTLAQAFAPGRGGAANLRVRKDRPGGVRAHCPGTDEYPPAGRFVMTPIGDGGLSWKVTTPKLDTFEAGVALLAQDVATLEQLDPPPRSQRDVQERCGWGGDRAMKALRAYRDQHKRGEAA